MKQVTIRSIQLEGFRSYSAPTSFKFNNTGLHLIKGMNGQGKTSLFSALTWALYKVNLNNTANTKIPTYKWLRGKEYKGTRVQVIFGIGKYKYLVARHIDFKGKTRGLEGNDSLLIFRKEKIDKAPMTSADIINDQLYKDDQQAYLNMLLGIDAKTFLNSVLFGQRMSRLMDSKDADKRDLFERLFDVAFIDALKVKATGKVNDANSILTQLNQDLAVATNNRELVLTQLNSAHNILDEFAADRKTALKAIKEEHVETKCQIEDTDVLIQLAQKKVAKSDGTDTLSQLQEASDTAREKYYTAKEEASNLNRDLADVQRMQSRSEATKNGLWVQLKNTKTKCPVCGSPLSAGKVAEAKAAIEAQIAEAVADIRRYEARSTELTAQVTVMAKNESKLLNAFTAALDAYNEGKQRNTGSTPQNELLALQQKRSLLQGKLKQLTANYNTEKERQPPTINVYAITRQLEDIDEQIPNLEKAIRIKGNLIKRLNWWITKAFGSGGLKSYIFSVSLNKLNSCVAAYTAYFNISIVFGIDLTKASKPFYCHCMLDGINEVDYDSLSGGEKQKVDLAIAFGLQDAAESIVSFNISILDEPEGNLDQEVLEVFDMLLRIRSEKKSCYVISHNSNMDLAGAEVYTISGGKNGLSVID